MLGIIGSNGAGKSTLLKIITGVLNATAGSVEVAGRITAILELGLGLNAEYSGRENIYLSGLLYGMDRLEVDRKIESIVAFSSLGDFIERPVKTYSSGMRARLAFSIATAVDPDILIIDEALAAGDAAFVQKCLRRIRQLCSGGRTVLLVSHGTGLLAQLCQRVMWMERGAIRMVGPAIQVVQAYDLAAHQSADLASWIETVDDDLAASTVEDQSAQSPSTVSPATLSDASSALVFPEQSRSLSLVDRAAFGGAAPGSIFQQGGAVGRQVFRRGPVFIENVRLFDQEDRLTTRLTLLQPFTLKIQYRVDGPLPKPTLGIALAVNNKHDLSPVAQYITQNIRPFETRESYDKASDRFPAARRGTLTLDFDYVPFRKGEYILSLGLLPNEPGTWEFYEYRHLYYPFTVDDAGMDLGAPVLLNPVLRHAAVLDKVYGAAIEPDARGRDPILVPTAPVLVGANGTTLRGEIEQICMAKGGYPDRWPRHLCCPACGKGPLVEAFSKYGFSHVRCGTCGFICVDPYPTAEIMTKLYAGEYYSRVRELFERPLLEKGGANTPFSAPRDILEAAIRRASNERTTGTWLDVGGGLGAFAHLIRKIRPRWKVKLNEFNSQSIAIARELFDFEVVTGDLSELLRQDERFDVISSVAVLEHIPLPLNFLTGYAALLKPGGWLVTVLPHFSPLNAFVSHWFVTQCGAALSRFSI